MPQLEHYTLASVTRLSTPNGTGRNVVKAVELCVSATLFSGEPSSLVAEIREKPAGKVSNNPAFLLPGDQTRPPSVVLLSGLPARALSIRFFDTSEPRLLDLRLAELSERGGNYELWSCTRAGAGSELTLASEWTPVFRGFRWASVKIFRCGGLIEHDRMITMLVLSGSSTLKALLLGALLIPSLPAFSAICRAKSGLARATVIKLFTSEGCSRCPPADRWLSGFAGGG